MGKEADTACRAGGGTDQVGMVFATDVLVEKVLVAWARVMGVVEGFWGKGDWLNCMRIISLLCWGCLCWELGLGC